MTCLLCKAAPVPGWSICQACFHECEEARREMALGHYYDGEDLLLELQGGPKALTRVEKDRGSGI